MGKRAWNELEGLEEIYDHHKAQENIVKGIKKIIDRGIFKKDDKVFWEHRNKKVETLKYYLDENADELKGFEKKKLADVHEYAKFLDYKDQDFHKNFFKTQLTEDDKKVLEMFYRKVDTDLAKVKKKILFLFFF